MLTEFKVNFSVSYFLLPLVYLKLDTCGILKKSNAEFFFINTKQNKTKLKFSSVPGRALRFYGEECSKPTKYK